MAPPEKLQLAFLTKIQRIFSEGDFVSTYKYALLHALADLAVTLGDDSGDTLKITTRQIAERIIELYWRQAIEFPWDAKRDPFVLRQNTGGQASIVSDLNQAMPNFNESLTKLRGEKAAWNKTLTRVASTIRTMPLWKLQTVGRLRDDFLYENIDKGNEILLKPGIAYCLRKFHKFLTSIIRTDWIAHIRGINGDALGDAIDLESFLFGTERTDLAGYRENLLRVGQETCFYCSKKFKALPAVDHFIPWARYQIDLGHNFVLACKTCNSRKSHFLAAEPHLTRWVERNTKQGPELSRLFTRANLPHDIQKTTMIARWTYRQTASIGGDVWLKGKEMQGFSCSPMRLDALFSC